MVRQLRVSRLSPLSCDPVQSRYASPISEMTITAYGHNLTIRFENDNANHQSLSSASASCSILNSVLGPLELNRLSHDSIEPSRAEYHAAVPGAGNLLGNLLCAVANLLNGGSLTVSV
jgi:hypothetical protein